MLPVPVCAAQKGASTRKQAPKSRNRNGFEPMLCIRPPSRGSAYSWCYSTTVGYLCQGESGARSMGGGVALLDYNKDGLLDIFFVNSGRLDDPVKQAAQFSRSDPAYWNRLYRQNRDGSFTDVTERA